MDGPAHVSELASLRREVASEIGRVEGVLGTQIGAVEKTVTAQVSSLESKLDSMKWKVVGGAAAQLLAAAGVFFAAKPQAAHDALEAVGRMVGIA